LQASESEKYSDDDSEHEEYFGSNILDNILEDNETEDEPEPVEDEVRDRENDKDTTEAGEILENNTCRYN